MVRPVRLFAIPDLGLDRAEWKRLLTGEGSSLFEGWSDSGRWQIILPWPEEIRTLSWENASEWLGALKQITEHPFSGAVASSDRAPFIGGWVGFIAYEPGAAGFGIAPYETTPPEPPLWFARHERGVIIDPDGDTFMFCREDQRETTAADLAAIFFGSKQAAGENTERSSVLQDSLPPARYRHKVELIREAIRRGDLYQVNVTRCLTAEGSWDPFPLYLALTGDEPPRCSAYINGGSWQIASASPEVFLRYDALAGVAESRPIKGTVSRTGDDAADIQRLASSEKDASEHLMIVDLIRNDLGKIAPPGKVRVASFRDILHLRHVLHLESTVRASGLHSRTLADIFSALFPSGSITGAPKRAVVQFIRELEPVPRGVYTGAIGYWDFRGRSEWSVAIRTAVIAKDHARYHAGGGVVWDSIPDAEERESLAKAQAFLDYCRAAERTNR